MTARDAGFDRGLDPSIGPPLGPALDLEPGLGPLLGPDAEDVPQRRLSPARLTLRRLLHHRLFMTGFVVFVFVLVVAVLAPWITSADPNRLAMQIGRAHV